MAINLAKMSNFQKFVETFPHGPLIRRALTASQVEDLGLQAILEKMNSLNTPLISGPCGNVSAIF